MKPLPPHTTMRFPVQTAVCAERRVGAPTLEVAVHVFVAGS
jgi:hypothetical protein